MTASRVDPRTVPMLRGRTAMLVASLTSVLLAACHAGLPPEPPGADPADPAAGAAPYQVQPNPYEISAFAGEPAPKADGHAGHGTMDHSSMGHGSTSEQTPATAAPTGHEQHMGHGSSTGGKQVPAPAPAAPTGHEHMNHGSSSGDPAPAPATPEQPEHTGHAMPPNMHMLVEAPR